MNQHDEIDDERAALIDQRIGQTFDFLGDVIDDPQVLEAIPDGSRLAFRDVAIRQYHFRLTAYRPSGPAEHWTARVTGYTRTGSQVGSNPRSIENRTHAAHGTKLQEIQTGKTPTEALDALETEVRNLVRIPA